MASVVTFDRGQTYNGPTLTIDTTNYTGVGLEGQIRVWDRDDSTTEGAQIRTNQKVVGVIVRNTSGGNLLPGRILRAASGFYGKRVDGYTTTTAALACGVVDDRLPSAGVRNGDLFYMIVQGPCFVRQSLSNLATDVAQGDWLFAITGATSQCTTSGRFDRYVGTFGDTHTTNGAQFDIMNHGIGYSMSTSLTSNTNGNVLVDLRLRY